mmetsp:Transcript_25152/g.72422  ORF Transcript_25152/g.72422 Transcript_25152/m.72422 type:complete len:339 (+) Transcript_25152:802-1818(+)
MHTIDFLLRSCGATGNNLLLGELRLMQALPRILQLVLKGQLSPLPLHPRFLQRLLRPGLGCSLRMQVLSGLFSQLADGGQLALQMPGFLLLLPLHGLNFLLHVRRTIRPFLGNELRFFHALHRIRQVVPQTCFHAAMLQRCLLRSALQPRLCRLANLAALASVRPSRAQLVQLGLRRDLIRQSLTRLLLSFLRSVHGGFLRDLRLLQALPHVLQVGGKTSAHPIPLHCGFLQRFSHLRVRRRIGVEVLGGLGVPRSRSGQLTPQDGNLLILVSQLLLGPHRTKGHGFLGMLNLAQALPRILQLVAQRALRSPPLPQRLRQLLFDGRARIQVLGDLLML